MSYKIDTIIFDLGGVLVDWDPMNLYKKVFSSEEKARWFLNTVCTPEWNIEQDGGRLIADAVELKVSEYPEYKKEIELFYQRWKEMFTGVIQTNIDLQQQLINNPNYKVYALTNWSAEKWDIALELFPFFKDFDGVIVSGIEKTRKPFDAIYQLILYRFHINPKNALFIDDNLENVNAAKRNKLNAIQFTGNELLAGQISEFNIFT
ncbi:MAG: HAD family phosphatase [Urechidicola sp.]|nr:HAD family phosphatase [Urechidicola sp.]